MKHTGKILVVSILAVIPLFVMNTFGKIGLFIYLTILVVAYFALIVYRLHPVKGRPWFYNSTGKIFRPLDIVYDRGSATRPNIPGILKMDSEGWFLVYDDGFEWPMSDPKNIELFIYQQK